MEPVEKSNVGIVNGKEWLQECDKLPGNLRYRTSVILSLLQSYGLFDLMATIEPSEASDEELASFHSREYLGFCNEISRTPDQEKFTTSLEENLKSNSTSIEDEFGVEFDCPILPNLSKLISWIAGGSLSAAKWLTAGHGNKAINWGGGWHHAQRDKASGFCYVNDIVIAVHELRKKYDRILYVDLDVHHGDGVENAFAFTKKVFTFSMHKYSTGYFPGSGKLSDVGLGAAKYHCMNIPLKDGLNDLQYNYIFKRLFPKIVSRFRPDAFVIQCGADSLAGDPLGGFNLTPEGMGKCIDVILQEAETKPALFLGGGGYNRPNTARYWAMITNQILSKYHVDQAILSNDIPETPFFSLYGPSFELCISKGYRRSEHTDEEIELLIESALRNLEYL